MAERKKDKQVNIPIPTLLTPSDIAQYLRVNYYTVRDLRHAGRIPPPDITIGNRPRWKTETITALLNKGHI
ncbi:MAG: helix-turn-helix domain-containing protein [Chitinivibrionales bacterium]|nr:helix-turn-helix domain-containing protein [Chitinivibrionales bacterium]